MRTSEFERIAIRELNIRIGNKQWFKYIILFYFDNLTYRNVNATWNAGNWCFG